jgi:hypothetical protein
VALVLLVGCGRFGFGGGGGGGGGGGAGDAPIDHTIDLAIDADERLPGLLAWYRMDDDPSDGTIDDGGGASHVARCINGVSCPVWVAGHRGMALQFDGSTSARITYGAWLATPTAYSIAAWIYIDDSSYNQVAFAKPYGANSQDSWDIVTWSPASGTGTCMETQDGAGAEQWVCGPTLPAGQWFHVAGRWDGSTKALFINGVKAGEVTNAPASLLDNHDVVLGIDENNGSAAYQFHGKLDELEIYDRALTDTEIAGLAAK